MSNQPYTVVGGELGAVAVGNKVAKESKAIVFKDVPEQPVEPIKPIELETRLDIPAVGEHFDFYQNYLDN